MTRLIREAAALHNSSEMEDVSGGVKVRSCWIPLGAKLSCWVACVERGVEMGAKAVMDGRVKARAVSVVFMVLLFRSGDWSWWWSL